MSFIDITNDEDIPITNNPEITLFYKHQFDPELHKKSDINIKTERVTKQKFLISDALDYGVMYRHTPFDKTSIVFSNDKFISNGENCYALNKLNTHKDIKQYNHILDIVFCFVKNNQNDNLHDIFETICLTVGDLPFNITPNQIILYNTFYKNILYESTEEFTFKLPITFFEGNGESLPIIDLLDINLNVMTKENIIFNTEFFVVQVGQDEARKLRNYYRYSTFNRMVSYSEEKIDLISNVQKITTITNKNYPIKELFWTYDIHNNKNIKVALNVMISLTNEEKTKTATKFFSQHQCTVSSQLSHFGKVLNNYYLHCFSCFPQTKHPTGEVTIGNGKLSIEHDLHCDYEHMEVTVKTIIFGVRMLTFYHTEDDEKIKCKFTSLYEAIANCN